MTKKGKRELLEAIRPRYLRASTTEKTHILDEFVATTGYHRKYAIRLLKHGRKQARREKRGRSKVYQGEVVSALIKIWEVCDRICSRRLHPFLPEIVAVLEREGELVLSEETKGLLLHMSRASMDRCLQAVRYQGRRGRSTTKPGTLLKQAIPVRTFADLDDVRPGFVEMDRSAELATKPGGSRWRFCPWGIPPDSQRRGHSDPLVGMLEPGQSQSTPGDGGHGPLASPAALSFAGH